jgi:hypothetical protein
MINNHPLVLMACIVPAIVLSSTNIYAGAVLEEEGFEKGLGNWKQSGQVISVQSGGCRSGNKCILIERSNARDLTVISQLISVPRRGRLTLSGYVKASNVSIGSKFYERGKFVASIFENKSECCWKDDDFDGSMPDWIERRIVIDDVEPSTPVMLRIGLQNAKGAVLIDDVSIKFEPN